MPVITGYGVVTTAGSGAGVAWDALAAAVPAGRDWQPDPENAATVFAAPIPDDYRAHPDIPRNLAHFMDRGSAIALDAALQALAVAGHGQGSADSRRIGLVDGLPYRAPGQPAIFVPYGHLIARATGIRGPVTVMAGAESSGLAAVLAAARLVARGEVDIVVAGAGQALQPPLLEHLRAQGFASRTSGRPFDVAHNGYTAAEGAAYLVIESDVSARERGAVAYARISGSGETFDTVAEPLVPSDPAEAGRAQQAALASAGYLQNQVDLVLSCADGRLNIDFTEGYGLRRTFGRHAYYAGVTTIAGALGFSLAAHGPLSVAMALECFRRQQVFPIAGFETPEKDIELAYVREPRAERIDCILVNSLGVGGVSVSLLLQRPV